MLFPNEKQNSPSLQSPSRRGQFLLEYYKQHSRDQKDRKIGNLRQVYTSNPLNWQQPLPLFQQALTASPNLYSLLLTLFELAQDPLWRNRTAHLCATIKTLHNCSLDHSGDYLQEMTLIPDYHHKLCRIFYLNDNHLQQHFKLLITLYLTYNTTLHILDQNAIALGLVHAGRCRTDGKLAEYLWLVSQIRVGQQPVGKVLKAVWELQQGKHTIEGKGSQPTMAGSQQLLEEKGSEQNTLLPALTILSNFIYQQKDPFVLDQLIENDAFQGVFISGLHSPNPSVSRQALLLCNNLLAKSRELALKILSSSQVLTAARSIASEEQPILQQLVRVRLAQLGQ